MEETQQTLSIPSLLAFAVVSFFAIRYFFFSPTTAGANAWGNSTPPGASQNRRRTFPAASVDTLVSMFPQLDRRDVEWNLVNNGGSVQATTERVLTGGRLPAAPRNFVPVYNAPPSTASSSSSQGPSQRQRQQQKPTYQDLITRYGLSLRVAEAALQASSKDSGDTSTASEELQTSEKQKEKGGWSSSKVDRQALLKKRREDMVLAARRKMEERERREDKGKGRVV